MTHVGKPRIILVSRAGISNLLIGLDKRSISSRKTLIRAQFLKLTVKSSYLPDCTDCAMIGIGEESTIGVKDKIEQRTQKFGPPIFLLPSATAKADKEIVRNLALLD